MKPLVVVVLAVAMGGCGPARAPLADGAGPAAGAQAVLAAPYAPGGERGTPEVIRNGELMAEVAERMRAIGRAEGGLVTLESDQLRRILTAYWQGEAPEAARRMVGTTDTGVRVVVATVPYGEEDRLAAAGRLFAAAAAGEVPAPQAVRWNAARDGVEVAFASPEFEQVAKSEKLRVRVSELARMPARVVRGGQVARVSGSAGGDTPPG